MSLNVLIKQWRRCGTLASMSMIYSTCLLDEAAQQIDTPEGRRGKLKQLSRVLWSYISIQGNILLKLAKAAQSGSRILAIQVRSKEEADLAMEILQADHPHPIEHLGLYGEVIQSGS
jgi:hypothetical protein